MHFEIEKELLVKALKDVGSAVATRVVQPILSNILINSDDNKSICFVATDLDLAIETKSPGTVFSPGSITLPGKKLLEIVAKLPNKPVTIQVNKETLETTITCQRSRFSLSGLSADEFPKLMEKHSSDGIVMPSDILRKAIVQTSFSAASYDTSNILGGVYLLIQDSVFEATATDGSRLAHRSEELRVSSTIARKEDGDKEIDTKSSKTATIDRPVALKAIVPARACGELLKLLDSKETRDVRLSLINGHITFETENHFLSSRLISGEYPRYHELFPTECKYECYFDREQVLAAIDRVAVMSDDRTHLIKMHFEDETLQISANTPDVGRANEELSIRFEGQGIDIAVNVRYVLDVLQRLENQEIQLEMTGPLKPLIFKGAGDENYKYLLMPVQAK